MDEQEKLRTYYIPPNVNNKHMFAQRIKWRNLIEAVLWTVMLGAIIYNTAFLIKVKLIFALCIIAPIAIFNLLGIKNRSITEFVIAFIRDKIKSQKYHLRSVADERSTKPKLFTSTIPSPTDESGSLFNIFVARVKQSIKNRKLSSKNNNSERDTDSAKSTSSRETNNSNKASNIDKTKRESRASQAINRYRKSNTSIASVCDRESIFDKVRKKIRKDK